jgi:hypothetical protein
VADLDELQLSLRWQVWHAVFWIGTKAKAALDGTLDREIARERDRQRSVRA